MKYNISWRAVDSGKWQIEGGSITSYLPNNSIVGPASVTVTAAFVRNETILQNKSSIVKVLHQLHYCMDSDQIFNLYFQVVYSGRNMHCLIFLREKVLSKHDIIFLGEKVLSKHDIDKFLVVDRTIFIPVCSIYQCHHLRLLKMSGKRS